LAKNLKNLPCIMHTARGVAWRLALAAAG